MDGAREVGGIRPADLLEKYAHGGRNYLTPPDNAGHTYDGRLTGALLRVHRPSMIDDECILAWA